MATFQLSLCILWIRWHTVSTFITRSKSAYIFSFKLKSNPHSQVDMVGLRGLPSQGCIEVINIE